MNWFIEHIATVRLDGTYTRFLNTLSKTPLLVLNDFGLAHLDIITQITLFQMMEDRYQKISDYYHLQLSVKEWLQYIGQPTLADAIMGILTATNHRLGLKEESLRKNNPLSSTLLS